MVMRPLQEKLVLGDGNWKNFTTAQKGLYLLSLVTGALYRFGPMIAIFALPLAFGIPTWPVMLISIGAMVVMMAITKVIEHFLQVEPTPTAEDSALLMVASAESESNLPEHGLTPAPSPNLPGVQPSSAGSDALSTLGVGPSTVLTGNQFATIHAAASEATLGSGQAILQPPEPSGVGAASSQDSQMPGSVSTRSDVHRDDVPPRFPSGAPPIAPVTPRPLPPDVAQAAAALNALGASGRVTLLGRGSSVVQGEPPRDLQAEATRRAQQAIRGQDQEAFNPGSASTRWG
jgi:hypothetical protein